MTPAPQTHAVDAPVRDNAEVTRSTSDNGWSISDLERSHYEFEGGGAANERRPRSHRNWFARLFRKAMRGA